MSAATRPPDLCALTSHEIAQRVPAMVDALVSALDARAGTFGLPEPLARQYLRALALTLLTARARRGRT